MKRISVIIKLLLVILGTTQLLHSASSKTTCTRTGISGEHKSIIWGVSQFQGTEANLEDRTIAHEPLGLFAVLDGHGGADVAQEATEIVPDFVKKYSKTKPSLVWPNIILDTDNKIRKTKKGSLFSKKLIEGGATFTGTIIKDGIAYIANLGDSRALLIRDSNVIAITDAHTPANAAEQARIEAAGGPITNNQIIGIRSIANNSEVLSVSRSLGDSAFKLPATVLGDWSSNQPDVVEWPLQKGDIIVFATNYTIDDTELTKIIRDELSDTSNELFLLENEARTDANGQKSGQRIEAGNDNTPIAIARAIRDAITKKESGNNANINEIHNTSVMVIMYQ